MHNSIACTIQYTDINNISIFHSNTEMLIGPEIPYKHFLTRFEPSEYAVFPSLSFAC